VCCALGKRNLKYQFRRPTCQWHKFCSTSHSLRALLATRDHEHPFQMITIILTVIGPAADYSSLGRWPLLVASVIYWASMFSTITLTCKLQRPALAIYVMLNTPKIAPSRWRVAMALYTVGSVAYGVAVAFYAAIFPTLSRNRKHIRELKQQYEQGTITVEEYEQAESLEKSRISSISIVGALLSSSRPLPVMTYVFRPMAPSAMS